MSPEKTCPPPDHSPAETNPQGGESGSQHACSCGQKPRLPDLPRGAEPQGYELSTRAHLNSLLLVLEAHEASLEDLSTKTVPTGIQVGWLLGQVDALKHCARRLGDVLQSPEPQLPRGGSQQETGPGGATGRVNGAPLSGPELAAFKESLSVGERFRGNAANPFDHRYHLRGCCCVQCEPPLETPDGRPPVVTGPEKKTEVGVPVAAVAVAVAYEPNNNQPCRWFEGLHPELMCRNLATWLVGKDSVLSELSLRARPVCDQHREWAKARVNAGGAP